MMKALRIGKTPAALWGAADRLFYACMGRAAKKQDAAGFAQAAYPAQPGK